jgi:uncharacterized membrane protein YhhN
MSQQKLLLSGIMLILIVSWAGSVAVTLAIHTIFAPLRESSILLASALLLDLGKDQFKRIPWGIPIETFP